MSSLGHRCVQWALSKVGVTEQPLGSNSGPEVREWLRPCVRGDTDRPLNLTASNWCAGFASAAVRATIRLAEGEPWPHGYRAGVVELVADAASGKYASRWVKIDQVRSGLYVPQPGDLAIWDRSIPADPSSSWYRHVNRVVEAKPNGTFDTVGGNENQRVGLGNHPLAHPKLLGFVAYSQADVDDLSEDEKKEILAQAALGLDGIIRESVWRR